MHTKRKFKVHEWKKIFNRKQFSLKKQLILLISICWLLPIMIIFVNMSSTYQMDMIKKTEDIRMEETKAYTMALSYNINEVIDLTKNLFYDRLIETPWQKYMDGAIDWREYYDESKKMINIKFDKDWRIDEAFFYLLESPEQIYPCTTGELEVFQGNVKEAAHEVSANPSARAIVKVVDKEIYIFRNIYAIHGYKKIATMVIKLNTQELLNRMNSSDEYDLVFYINKGEENITYDRETKDCEQKKEILEVVKYNFKREGNIIKQYQLTDREKQYQGFVYQKAYDDYNLCSILIIDRTELFVVFKTLVNLVEGLLIVVIPILAIFILMFKKNFTFPIEHMVEAFKEIKEGNMGIQIPRDRDTMPNQEFIYLVDSFNEMSTKIKYLFNYAYNEEIARKDAQIIALQSQINPHFLNNTLEMMNWQARMAGDVSVSKMIEALSTLLDYTMNRESKRLISLAEEIRCADAYLYIISMRFGQRLQVEKEIDQSILQTQVPQIILQPLLENAVLHGIESENRGTIWLQVYKKEANIFMEVRNTGKKLTKEKEEKIASILNGEQEIKKGRGQHTSLGIRNVNQRIKLIYGDNYGLTIKSCGENITCSTIKIPFEGDIL
mgnify:CR=1 FL=1